MAITYMGVLSGGGQLIVGSQKLDTITRTTSLTWYDVERAERELIGFDGNATWCCWDDDVKASMVQSGFTRILDLRDFQNNETVTFWNGNYIKFVNEVSPADPNRTNYGVNFFLADDTVLGGLGGNSLNSHYAFSLLSDEPILEAGQPPRFYPAQVYFDNPGQSALFQPMNAVFPLISQPPVTTDFWLGIDYSTDPYFFGGENEEAGGIGVFDNTSDFVGVPPLPVLSANTASFITLYTPTLTQLRNLASYLWTGAFDPNNLRKMFSDPMDAILGLSIVPVSVPIDGTVEVYIGNVATGIYMDRASTQYVSVDCGSIQIKEFWGAYLDYNPYTQVEIYLPYIGIRPLSADIVMGRTIRLVYHVDVLSGACVAYIEVDGNVLYSFIGQCSSSVPINANNWTSVINGVLGIAGSIGSIVATGGASAPMATTAMIASASVNSFKERIEKSGAMSGAAGLLSIQKPYLIITRPKQALPAQQNRYTGYPTYINKRLGDLSGYTEVDSIHLENVPVTSDEFNEIETLLKGGVIL